MSTKQPRPITRAQMRQQYFDHLAEIAEKWNREYGPGQRYELGDLVLTVGEKAADKTPWIMLQDTEDEAEVMILGQEALNLLREALDRIQVSK